MKPRLIVAALLAIVAVGAIGYGATRFYADVEDNALAYVPKDAFVYVNTFLEPSTTQKRAIRELLTHFPQAPTPEEAGEELKRLINLVLDESDLEYERDIEPWLGGQIAFWARPPQDGDDVDGAGLIATSDGDAALETIAKAVRVEGDEFERGSYKGFQFRTDASAATQDTYGVVGDFLVVGSESGFKGTVDAYQGESLETSRRLREVTEPLVDDRLAVFFYDGKAFLDALGEESGVPPEVLSSPFFAAAAQPVGGAVYARADSLVFDVVSPIQDETGLGMGMLGGSVGSGLLPEMPGDAWGAIGGKDFGRGMQQIIDVLVESNMPGFDRAALAQLEAQIGLDLERDVLSWMGDVGLFVQGTTLDSLGGAFVIESTDPSRSKATVNKIFGLMLGHRAPVRRAHEFRGVTGFAVQDATMPQPVLVLAPDDRVVIAYGRPAAEEAIAADAPLEGVDDFERSLDALGEEFAPGMFFDIDPILELADNLGAAGERTYQEEVKPYLDPLAHLVLGTRLESDVLYQRLVIGVD